MTGYNTFFKGQKAIHVHDDVDNKDWVFHKDSPLRIERNGKEERVLASELQVTDHILEYLEK